MTQNKNVVTASSISNDTEQECVLGPRLELDETRREFVPVVRFPDEEYYNWILQVAD